MTFTTLCWKCGGHGLVTGGNGEPQTCSACGCAGIVWPARCDVCGLFGTLDQEVCSRCEKRSLRV